MGSKKANEIGKTETTIIERKKEIIEKHENDFCVSDLVLYYGLAKSFLP